MRKLWLYYWPAAEFRQVDDLQPHEVASVQMRNRWRLDRLRPYLWRWAILTICFGAVADLGAGLAHGPLGFLVFVVGLTGFVSAGFMLGFWSWLYSLRPR